MVECKYRGRVIGVLFLRADGFLGYASPNNATGQAMVAIFRGDSWMRT